MAPLRSRRRDQEPAPPQPGGTAKASEDRRGSGPGVGRPVTRRVTARRGALVGRRPARLKGKPTRRMRDPAGHQPDLAAGSDNAAARKAWAGTPSGIPAGQTSRSAGPTTRGWPGLPAPRERRDGPRPCPRAAVASGVRRGGGRATPPRRGRRRPVRRRRRRGRGRRGRPPGRTRGRRSPARRPRTTRRVDDPPGSRPVPRAHCLTKQGRSLAARRGPRGGAAGTAARRRAGVSAAGSAPGRHARPPEPGRTGGIARFLTASRRLPGRLGNRVCGKRQPGSRTRAGRAQPRAGQPPPEPGRPGVGRPLLFGRGMTDSRRPAAHPPAPRVGGPSGLPPGPTP